MLELVYTSIPEGLQPGRSGYTSAAWTRGMPPMLVPPLENMSVYRHLYLPGTAERNSNPVSYAWTFVRFGNSGYPILSRTGDAGLDYTGRSSKLAHHILWEPEDLAGRHGMNPAGFLLAPDNFLTVWDGPPRLLEPRTKLEAVPVHLPAEHWRKMTGDAGYAGWAARTFLNRKQPGGAPYIYLEFSPEISSCELLQMAAETAELLPPEERMDFTFNTYFCQAQDHIQCFLRCCIQDSPMVQTARQFRRGEVLRLPGHDPLPGSWDHDPLVMAARSGKPEMPAAEQDCAGTEPGRQDTITLLPPEPAIRSGNAKGPSTPSTAGPQTAEAVPRRNWRAVARMRFLQFLPVLLLLLCIGGMIAWRLLHAGPGKVRKTAPAGERLQDQTAPGGNNRKTGEKYPFFIPGKEKK